ncbi:MAG: FUN14 domain-containing protein [Nitrososphaeraceae archaeon]
MVTSIDETGIRFFIALIAGPMMGWALGYFIRKSIKVIAFIGGMFFCIIGVLYYSRAINNLSVLQNGVENTIETAVNRTVDISNQALADSGGDLSIPLFVSGFIVGLGLGLNNSTGRRRRLVIEN